MSEHLERHIEIDAPAERVWRILVNFPRFADWNPFITGIVGEAAPGTRLTVSFKPRGRRCVQFRPTVLAVLPAKQLRWLGRLLVPGLVDGEHGFRLQARNANRTLFIQYGIFSGFLVPFMWRSMGTAIDEGFASMNLALKERAENPELKSN